MNDRRDFVSDNCAGAHAEVLAVLGEANGGHVPSYGDDPWTARAVAAFRRHFGADAEVFLVFNGTGANVLGLQGITEPHHAIICARGAHIEVDECGAPERYTGCKLLPVLTTDGKLRPRDLGPLLRVLGIEHSAQPHVVSLTEATELGTVYRPDEIAELAQAAHSHGLLLHMDGARLANATVSLGVELRALTTDAGVDLLSFGGTKNGLLGAEAVVFLRGQAPANFKYVRKQGMQLASKMRFLAAQFVALLEGDLWHRNATRANAMARRLAAGVEGLPRVRLTQPVEANALFATIPPECVAPLQARANFYVWNEATTEVRWMTAFDTTEDDVDRFVGAIREVVR